MLESDYPVQEPPLVSPSDEQSYDAEEVVPPAPDKSDVSVPRSTAEIAKVELNGNVELKDVELKDKVELKLGAAAEPSQTEVADDGAVASAQSPMQRLANGIGD